MTASARGGAGTRPGGKHMAFRLAAEEYAIPVLDVREIIRIPEITRLPHAPPYVRGVINLRGRILPVVDLRLELGLPAESSDQAVIIVVQQHVRGADVTTGLLVDEVIEVLEIPADQIEPPPGLGPSHPELDFVRGVGKPAGRVVFLLDVARVLGAEEREAIDAAVGTETQGASAADADGARSNPC